MFCAYPGDRDETLIAYLYGEVDPALRATFDAHLMTCARCRSELAGLRGVRTRLAQWAPPEPSFAVVSRQSSVTSQQPSVDSPGRHPWKNLREIPAWAQVAAALLFLGVSAGIANLDVRYDSSGLAIRTGWSKPAAVAQSAAGQGSSDVSNADLTALAQQMRTEWHAAQAASASMAPATIRSVAPDADVMRRVRALVDESERRQQRELALRVGELIQDVHRQREADLVRIDRSLGLMQNTIGVAVQSNKQQQYLMRVNQRQ
jgi:anti-sigma factor RsiW